MNAPDSPLADLQINPAWAKLPLFDRSGWKTMQFGEFAESVNDRVEPSAAADAIYVGLEHLDSDSLHLRRWGKGSDITGTKLRFRKGDIIFGRRRAYQRKLAVAEFDGICSAHAMVVRAKQNAVLPEFLTFLMMSERFMSRAVEISVGSLSPTINWTTLKVETFDLPPLDQQARIARFLWSTDDALEKSRAASRVLEQFARAMSDAIFESHNKKRHLAAADVCEQITVGIVVKPASFYTNSESGIAALRSLNVFPGRYDLANLVYLTPEGHRQHSKSQLKIGDVVVVRTGRPGDAAVVTDEVSGMNLIDLILVRPKPVLLAEYLVEFLNSTFGRRKIYKGSAGTAQQHFNVSEFSKLDIPIPPVAEQKEAVTRIAALRVQSSPLKLQAEVLTALQKESLKAFLA